jgi:hypothetical protein
MSKFGPKQQEHLDNLPPEAKMCGLCLKPFEVGDYTTLIPLGPEPDDMDAVRAYLTGRVHNARAVEIHWDCLEQVDGILLMTLGG